MGFDSAFKGLNDTIFNFISNYLKDFRLKNALGSALILNV